MVNEMIACEQDSASSLAYFQKVNCNTVIDADFTRAQTGVSSTIITSNTIAAADGDGDGHSRENSNQSNSFRFRIPTSSGIKGTNQEMHSRQSSVLKLPSESSRFSTLSPTQFGEKANETESVSWKEYICFLIMSAVSIAAVQFYQGIADKVLGNIKKSVPIVLVTQYAVQVIVNITTPYWTTWMSHKTRIILASCLYGYAFILATFMHNQLPTEETLWHFAPIIMLLCIALNGIATVMTEITLLQYVGFYHKSCTNAISSGLGIGALIGASWALTFDKFSASWISIICCLVIPIILVMTFIYILPAPRQQTEETVDIVVDTADDLKIVDSVTKTSVTSDILDLEESGTGFDGSQIGIFGMIKMIFVRFAKYSLPLFASYFGFELIRSGLISQIWPKDAAFGKSFYQYFNWVFRAASGLGKMTTNWFSTNKYWIFPSIILVIGVEFIVMLALQPKDSTDLSYWPRTFQGQCWLIGLLVPPLGLAYGSTSASIYYAIREDVTDLREREFALGNVRQVTTYGQILAQIVAMLFA